MRDMHGAVWRAALASVALLVPLAMTGLLIGGTVPVLGVALDQQYVDTHDTPAAGASVERAAVAVEPLGEVPMALSANMHAFRSCGDRVGCGANGRQTAVSSTLLITR